MKKKIKLRDLTEEQEREWKNKNCPNLLCKNCPLVTGECVAGYPSFFIYHKDMFSDKFLDQEVEIDVPEILDEEEKAYLSAFIKPWRKNITSIAKNKSIDPNKEFISFVLNGKDTYILPRFDEGTMYKGMEEGRFYTLEDLGL
jgi:hypothetical protein